jgi:hypothetical protein
MKPWFAFKADKDQTIVCVIDNGMVAKCPYDKNPINPSSWTIANQTNAKRTRRLQGLVAQAFLAAFKLSKEVFR